MRHTPSYSNRSRQLLMVALAFLLAGVSSAVADLNDGLVAYWGFDEGEGDTAYDSSGNGHDGVVYGASWVAGLSGSALYFDGDDYVSIPPTDSQTPYSVALWFRHVEPLATGALIHRGFGGSCRYEPHLSYGNGYISASVSGCGHSGRTHYHIPVPVGQWHHVAYVVDAATQRFYIDGIEIEPAGSKIPNPSILYTQIGAAAQNNDGVATSQFVENTIIDEVRVYERALSTDEVDELWRYTCWLDHPHQQDENTEGDQSDTSGASDDPVNTATGSFFHQETDLSIPSRGSPLIFTRFYNSKAAAPGRKAGKAKQAPPRRKTATSQPASTKDSKRASIDGKKPGEPSSIDAKKQNESPAGKDQKQAANPSQAKTKTKEDSK